ncbi:MAG: tetratricopeptide repeat protein [bacterium]|nr:MAG: tetratricopeptide repeat protein [bacterium]
MKCVDPKMKKLVSLYQFNLLREEEKLSVEAHLVECDACFEEVYRLSPAIETIEEMPEFFLDALQPKETHFTQTTRSVNKAINASTMLAADIVAAISEWWKKPVIKILVPVTAIAILLLIFMPPDAKKYSDLAIIENASYVALKVRGLYNEISPSQNLYNQGMKYYQEKNYTEAIHKLSAFVKRKKKDAYGHFYLGVSFLLTNEYKKGIDHLKLSSKFSEKEGKEILLEKCFWYLGNAYLKTNDVEKALKEFKNVVAIGGEFKEDAIKQIERIHEMKGE